MASANYRLIKKAVMARRQIVARYKGRERFFCPHVLGHTDENVEVALCYQFQGSSNSKLIRKNPSPANWRCIHPSDLRDPQIRTGDWYSAPDYNPICTCVPKVDVSV